VLSDVSHDTCKEEEHETPASAGVSSSIARVRPPAFGAGHPDLPTAFATTGQAVFIGGSMAPRPRSQSGRHLVRSTPSPRPTAAPGGD